MFNNSGRTKNVIKTSAVGTICNVVNLFIGLVYRSIFLHFLSSAYLGLNGLFSGLLAVLSFTDLGIGGSISFRIYKPISDGNVEDVGKLVNFYKKIYLIVAILVLFLGVGLLPFLELFIKDTAEIPPDVNIRFIYILFLLQTVASYTYASPQMLLSADQKQYKLTLFQSGSKLIQYVVQIVILWTSGNYTLTLAFSIVTTLLLNYAMSAQIKKQYPDVFEVKEIISKEEKKEIFSDTKATLCHKVGGTVLCSTDSIILSSFVGLVTTGLYSNYSQIISCLNLLLSQLFGSFTSSLGNSHFTLQTKDAYQVYKRLLFANFWLSGMCTVCLVNLISDFITIWLGKDMVLDQGVIIVICIQFYLESIRLISTSYTFGCGLFSKDIIRPLIESAINIVVSIVLVLKIGMAGVFIGTIVSHILTVTWREPLLLYKYEFKQPIREYWKTFAIFTIMTLFISITITQCKKCAGVACGGIFWWLMEALGCIVIYNVLMLLLLFKRDEINFYLEFAKRVLKAKNIFGRYKI